MAKTRSVNWFSDQSLIEVLDKGVQFGWLYRQSHTQIQWTERGCDEARTFMAMDSADKAVETSEPDQFEEPSFENFQYLSTIVMMQGNVIDSMKIQINMLHKRLSKMESK